MRIARPLFSKLSFFLLNLHLLEEKSFRKTMFSFSMEPLTLENGINFLADQTGLQFRFTIRSKTDDRHSSKTPDRELYSRSVKFPD